MHRLAGERPGEAGRADKAILDHFPDQAGEQVLVQLSADSSNRDSAFRAAVDDVERRLAGGEHVRAVQGPFAAGNQGQLSRDGRSALVTFEVAGEIEEAHERVDGPLAAVGAAQRAHPDLRIEQFGDASGGKALLHAELRGHQGHGARTRSTVLPWCPIGTLRQDSSPGNVPVSGVEDAQRDPRGGQARAPRPTPGSNAVSTTNHGIWIGDRLWALAMLARTMLTRAARQMLASYPDEGREPPIGAGHVEPLIIDPAA